MRRLALLLAVAGCQPATWSRTDTALEVTFAAALAADYLQTRQIVADGMEGNPIMGARGERMPPALYFPASLVAHLVVASCLPRPWRSIFQGVSIGWQAAEVGHNAEHGYAVEW